MIFNITDAAAEDYKLNIDNMVQDVDNTLLSRTDINTLIGEDGIDMMKLNHRNHASFISVVLFLKRYSVLVETLPWVYRAYHSNGFSYNYFPVVIAEWVNKVKRYLKPENAEAIVELYRYIMDLHDETIKLSENIKPVIYNIEEQWKEIAELFFNALTDGDTYLCTDIAINSCHNEDDITNFYLNVVQPALYRIGELWETGKITAADEHLSTAIVMRVAVYLSNRHKPVINKDKRIIVLCSPGEYHQVGGMIVANCFEIKGWDVHFLSDSLPPGDIMKHIIIYKPHILAISVTMLFNITAVSGLIQRINKSDLRERMKILVGGQAFNLFPDLPAFIGADAYAANCLIAVETGERLRESIDNLF